MNWKNIDLNSASEREASILDAYTFDILLLEVNCNLPEINEETVKKQFEESLKSKIDCAREVFKDNLQNIIKQALKERKKP